MKCLAVLLAVVAVAFCAEEKRQPPPFLVGAPEAKVKEFEALVKSHHEKTEDVLHGQVQTWIKKQTPDIQKKFDDYLKEIEKVHKAGEIAHKAAIAKFSPEAKAADAEISKIADSKTLTVKEKGEQIDKLVAKLPKAVHDEIVKAMQGN